MATAHPLRSGPTRTWPHVRCSRLSHNRGAVHSGRSMTVTRLPIAALACSLGSRMKITLSYCSVSACERVRSSFQANASSKSSPTRNGRCRSFLFAGSLAKRGHERREQGVPLSQSARTSQPQLLDQPILQRLMRPLDPTLRLARIGADDVDVESVQRTPELGHPITAKRAPLVDTKHPMLVAVEGDRLSPSFEVGAGGSEISKGRLTLDKLEVHQATGRVANEHEQRALRPAILKPPVLAAVNLDQLANAIAPVPGLMDTLPPLLAIEPQPRFNHPEPQRLTAERDPMNLAQLLGRQGRAEIPVPFSDDRQCRVPKRLGLAPVATATSSLRDQARRP